MMAKINKRKSRQEDQLLPRPAGPLGGTQTKDRLSLTSAHSGVSTPVRPCRFLAGLFLCRGRMGGWYPWLLFMSTKRITPRLSGTSGTLASTSLDAWGGRWDLLGITIYPFRVGASCA